MKQSTHTNRLSRETSPYLLQHAHNPVDWYPWGEEALTRAREEDKPILLSIGYSACHWCHVMAHESFEDEETAALMNRYFINIKVDREERPDLDRIYQAAHQILTRRPGGWPLTMVLTPDQIPFIGGTYFPPEERYGLPGFCTVLQRIHEFYTENRDSISEQNASLLGVLQQENRTSVANLTDEPLAAALDELSNSFDKVHGGFGAAPKFPHVANLLMLLRHPEKEAQQMALFSLRRMAEGGLFDQIGGGFYRYSVDERWAIPHFEKMLYDNGPLLQCYVEAWQLSGDPFFRQVAEQTAEWAMREMQTHEGGYCASQDADTNGEEGGFYVWSRTELKELLSDEEYALAAPYYGIDEEPNFEGHYHLQISRPLKEIIIETGSDEETSATLLKSIGKKLLAARNARAELGRDGKILVSWNALMIKGMAYAGQQLDQPKYSESADRALTFIRQVLLRDGRLLASYKDGQAHYSAYLDDYAYLLDALLTLLQARWRDEDLTFANILAETLLEHFEDESHGGFYFTADDHEQLIQRPKPFIDESMPAGNGIAADALHRLGHLTGNLHYLDAAEKTLRSASTMMTQYPSAHGAMLCALQTWLHGLELLVLRGETQTLIPWREKLHSVYRPHRSIVAIPPQVTDLPPALMEKKVDGEAIAYRCIGQQCQSPIRSSSKLEI